MVFQDLSDVWLLPSIWFDDVIETSALGVCRRLRTNFLHVGFMHSRKQLIERKTMEMSCAECDINEINKTIGNLFEIPVSVDLFDFF